MASAYRHRSQALRRCAVTQLTVEITTPSEGRRPPLPTHGQAKSHGEQRVITTVSSAAGCERHSR